MATLAIGAAEVVFHIDIVVSFHENTVYIQSIVKILMYYS